MPKEAEHYQIFVGGKTKRSKPRLLKSVLGQKAAIKEAKEWKEAHPDRMVGVYKVWRIRRWTPKKKK